jgi:hypothetical protein
MIIGACDQARSEVIILAKDEKSHEGASHKLELNKERVYAAKVYGYEPGYNKNSPTNI